MRTHNQLHYYTIIPMKVTIFSAMGQTLQSHKKTTWGKSKEAREPLFVYDKKSKNGW